MGRKKSQLQERIAAYITSKGVFPRSVQPKEVARQLYRPNEDGEWSRFYQKTRKTMQRMSMGFGPRLKLDAHGWYRAYYTLKDVLMAENPDVTIHGLVLEGKIPDEKRPEGVLRSILGQSERSYEPPSPDNGGWTFHHAFEGRRVTFTIFTTGTILIRIRSSTHPLTPPEFSSLNGWLNGLLNNEVPTMNLYVIEVGVGRDFHILRLDGIKSIKWGAFINAYWELYQKNEETLRLALHIHLPKNEISLVDALNILQTATNQQLDLVSHHKFPIDGAKTDAKSPDGYQ